MPDRDQGSLGERLRVKFEDEDDVGVPWDDIAAEALAWMRERLPEILHEVHCVSPARRIRPWTEVDQTHKAGDEQDADAILALLTRPVSSRSVTP